MAEISWGVSIALLIGAWVLLNYLRNETYNRGESDRDNQTLRAENEALSNRPLTDADLIARLRNRAADQRQDNRKS